jgi:hypothetical protein
LLLGTVAFGADTLPPLPKDVDVLIGLARSAPPEVFADSIVRMVDGGRVPSVAWQKALLQDAFSAAQRAHEPVRLIPLPKLGNDTRENFRGRAADLRLDALSLESRILRAMLSIDRPAARQMFQAIPRPRLDTPVCKDPLVPDASAYYEAAAAVAQSAFTDADKKESAHVQFLTGVLAGATTPAEVAGFVRALQTVELKPSEMEMVLGAIEAKLAALPVNYRSFALTIEALADGLDFLAARARSQEISAVALGAELRRFTVAQMKGPRCEEDLGQATNFAATMPPKYLGEVAPLSSEETKPSSRGVQVESKGYFGEGVLPLAQSLSKLRFKDGVEPYSEAQRSTTDWRGQFAESLRAYEGWTPEGADIDVLHQRLAVLRQIMELTPLGVDRDRLLDLCVRALKSGSADRQAPAEWLWQARSIYDASGGDQRKIAQKYRASGVAGLVLLAELQ